MMDKFERFESGIIRGINNHKISFFIITGGVLTITLIATALSLMLGIAGLNITYLIVNNTYTGQDTTTLMNPLSVTEQEMQTWDKIIVPTVLFLFNWLSTVILIIGIGYIGGVIYFVVRGIYRSKGIVKNATV
jgi:hypothetical protein